MAALLLPSLPGLAAQTVRSEVLDNGMTLVVHKHQMTHALELRLLVRAGPAWEEALLGSGLSEVTRQLVLRGAEADARQFVAGRWHSHTRFDYTSFGLTTTDGQLGPALQALAGLVGSRAFEPEDFRQIQAQQLERLANRAVDEDLLVRRHIYREHPMRLPIPGRQDQLGQLNLSQAQQYFNKRYTANNMVLIVVGNVGDIDALRGAVTASFGQLPTGNWLMELPKDEPQQLAERTAVVGGVERQRDIFAWRTLPLLRAKVSYDDRPLNVVVVLEVVAELLRSPEFSPLRRAQSSPRVADDLSVRHVYHGGYSGYFSISYAPKEDKAPAAWSALAGVLETLRKDGPESEALAAAKKSLARRWQLAVNDPAQMAEQLAEWTISTGLADYGEDFQREVEGVEAEDIQAVVSRWLRQRARNRTKIVLDPRVQQQPSPLGAPGPTLDDPAPQEKELTGGSKLWLKQYSQYGLTHVGCVIAGGSSAETDDSRGAAVLLARLLRAGSEARNGRDLDRWLAQRGMQLTVQPSMHGIELMLTCFPEDVPLAIRQLSDLIKNPALPQDALTTALQAARAEQAAHGQTRGDWISRLLTRVRAAKLDGHYAAAKQPDFDGITRDKLLEFHQSQAVGSNLVFVVWGTMPDHDPEKSGVEEVTETFQQALTADPALVQGEAWKPQGTPWPEKAVVGRDSQSWDSDDTALALSWPGPALASQVADGPAFDLLEALLVGVDGQSGRLAAQLRPLEGVQLLDVRVVGETYAERGVWTLLVRFQGDDKAKGKVEDAARTAINLLREVELTDAVTGVTDEELARARSRCITEFVLSRQDQARTALDHAYAVLQDRSNHHHAYRNSIKEVQRTDLVNVANSYLAKEPYVVEILKPTVVVTPPDDGDTDGEAPPPESDAGESRPKAEGGQP